MGIGASLFLIAAGAVLKFATQLRTISDGWFWIDIPGVNFHHAHLDVAGVILIVVGALGLVINLFIHRPPSRGPMP